MFWEMQYMGETKLTLAPENITYSERKLNYIPMVFFVDRLIPTIFASIASERYFVYIKNCLCL